MESWCFPSISILKTIPDALKKGRKGCLMSSCKKIRKITVKFYSLETASNYLRKRYNFLRK